VSSIPIARSNILLSISLKGRHGYTAVAFPVGTATLVAFIHG